MMFSRPYLLLLSGLLLVLATSGCDTLLGSKEDDTTSEIFDEGRIDPTLFNEVEYVPFLPFFQVGADGQPFDQPQDVYVGFDELLYAVDAQGLHVLDLAGRPALHLDQIAGQPLRQPTSVIQDRRLHLYVTARRDTMLNDRTWDLPVIYHLAYDREAGTNVLSGLHLVDIIWHPFDDPTRRTRRDPVPTDEEVEFTGVAVLPDNEIFYARRGPINNGGLLRPHNVVVQYDPYAEDPARRDRGPITALSALQPSLLSSVNPTDVMTFVGPPQRQSFTDELDFFVAQSPYADGAHTEDQPRDSLRYGVLSIESVVTSDGIEFRPNTDLLQVTFEENEDPNRGFLYEEFKFGNPVDLAFAADQTQYIFVIDAQKDSLFTFTFSGVEGVRPPAGASASGPISVSFGGTGDGAREFRSPQGVAYFDEVVYVADTGNNRISRFKLNTDFE